MSAHSTDGNDWRTLPVYTVSQAATLAKTSHATIRRWLYGYEAPGHRMEPVLERRPKKGEQRAEISFLTLAEIVVVSAFRKRRVRLDRLRRAHGFAKHFYGIEYPFAFIKFKTDGAHVLLQYEKKEPGPTLLAADQGGQLALPGHVVEALEHFDFESEFASRWFPVSKDIPIVVDPRFAAGKPSIPERGVTIETLNKRWKAGQSIAFIARDYKLNKEIVESALQHAENLAA